MEMTEYEEIHVRAVDVARSQPLAQVGTVREVAGEERRSPVGPLRPTVPKVRMKPRIEHKYGTSMFDQVRGNRNTHMPLLTIDKGTHVHTEPTATKTPNAH